jgi:hypothetical protein
MASFENEGGMALHWMKLEISSSFRLKAEVDAFISSLQEISYFGDCIESAENQISAISDFIEEHGEDERVGSFEKQKKRLLKVLTFMIQNEKALEESAPAPEEEEGQQQQQQELELLEQDQEQAQYESDIVTSSLNTMASTSGRRSSPSKLRAKSPKRQTMNETSRQMDEALHASADSMVKQPIYAWEKEGADEVDPVATSFGVFYPSVSKGIYIAEHGDHEVSLETGAHMDLQLVFSDEELLALETRMRGARAERLHAARFKKQQDKNKLGVNASTPFLDKGRIQKEIYRSPNPEKWLDRKGFAPVGAYETDVV